jgi:hypothetical protein
MSNPNQQSAEIESPAGLIFLPDNIRDLELLRLGLMLNRGSTKDMSLADKEALYSAAEVELERLRTLATHAGHIAVVGAE